jgi:DNA (cytosine-5)-methyltransferase 1
VKHETKTMHLFAGHGGGLLADLILGHRPIAAVEWDGYACQVLRERAADGWFPGLRVHEGDISLFDPSEYTGIVDCIHAGFPCQDISVAGKQAGVSEGTRSGLYREVLRIAGVV